MCTSWRFKIQVNSGDIAVVMGPGPIGLLSTSVKSKGATVVVTGLDNDKVRLGKSRSIAHGLCSQFTKTDLKRISMELQTLRADVVVECSGAVPKRQGLDILRKKVSTVK